jgi:peptidoglycan/LPS O-acetylase OafA/YrhL
MQSAKVYKSQLDSLRLIAFLVVFVRHSLLDYADLGFGGVRLFFAISGFVITRVLLQGESTSIRNNLKTFYARRVLRIFPLYYLVITGLLIFQKLPYAAWFYTYLANLKIYSLAQWHSPLTFPLWTLCVEEQFYMLFPPLLLLTPKAERGYVIGILIVATMTCRLLLSAIGPDRSYDVLVISSGQFILWGCLACIIDTKVPSKTLNGTFVFFVGVVLLSLIYGWDWFSIPSPILEAFWRHNIRDAYHHCTFTALAISFACIVFGLWRTENRLLLKIFKLPPLVYLGRISYGLYMFHVLVLSLITWIFGDQCPWGRAIAGLAITIGISALSWHFFESPILKLKRFFPYEEAVEQ